MSEHLLASGGSENWILADSTDLDGLRRTIAEAMRTGDMLQSPVHLKDGRNAPVTLLLNASATPTVAFVEL